MDRPENALVIDRYIGSRLFIARRERAMSEADLAAALGVTAEQIEKYEAGDNRIHAWRLLAIARILNVPMTFFFEGAPGEPPPSRVA